VRHRARQHLYMALLAKNAKNPEQQAWAKAIRPLFGVA
jgi:hypothetical protein